MKHRPDKPLSGTTVLVTRPRKQASGLVKILRKKGARVRAVPAARIYPPRDWGPCDRALTGIERFHWLVFTSVNGVEFFFKRFRFRKKKMADLSGCRIAAIGDATRRALREAGARADLVPARFTSEALVRELARRHRIRGRKFLLARTDIAPEFLRRSLKKMGGEVTQVTVYRTGLPGPRRGILRKLKAAGGIDYAVFTSAACVQNFFGVLAPGMKKSLQNRCVSIGPVTTGALKNAGLRPAAEARVHTVEGIVAALEDVAKWRRKR